MKKLPPYLYSPRNSLEDEISPFRGKDISFHSEMLAQLCLMTSAILDAREDREEILQYQEPRFSELETHLNTPERRAHKGNEDLSENEKSKKRNIIEVVHDLSESLKREKVVYGLGGAFAYGFWAVPRSTIDIDINIFTESEEISPAEVERLLDVLQKMGCEFVWEKARKQALDRFEINVTLDNYRIDLFLPCLPFHGSAKKNLQTVIFQGREIEILSAEDICVFKLMFFRPKDKLDIERMVKLKKPQLNLEYIKKWLVEMVGSDDPRVEFWEGVLNYEL